MISTPSFATPYIIPACATCAHYAHAPVRKKDIGSTHKRANLLVLDQRSFALGETSGWSKTNCIFLQALYKLHMLELQEQRPIGKNFHTLQFQKQSPAGIMHHTLLLQE